MPKTNSKRERLEMKLLKKQLNQKIEMPEIPAAPEPLPAAPPPQATSQDQLDAIVNERRRTAKKFGPGRAMTFAGETGGYKRTILTGAA